MKTDEFQFCCSTHFFKKDYYLLLREDEMCADFVVCGCEIDDFELKSGAIAAETEEFRCSCVEESDGTEDDERPIKKQRADN